MNWKGLRRTRRKPPAQNLHHFSSPANTFRQSNLGEAPKIRAPGEPPSPSDRIAFLSRFPPDLYRRLSVSMDSCVSITAQIRRDRYGLRQPPNLMPPLGALHF